jgi:membrane-associated phospholipid phosphatase
MRKSALKSLNYWFLVPALLSLVLGSLVWLQLPKGEEVYWFNTWRKETWNTLGIQVTYMGEFYVWYCVIFFLALKSLKKAGLLIVASLLFLALNFGLKAYFHAPRPIQMVDKNPSRALVLVPNIHTNRSNTSFPSGHTSSAFCVFFIASQLLQKSRFRVAGFAFSILAIGVAISRIFLVQHYLEDVLAGTVLGLVFGWFVWILLERVATDELRENPL